jgi:4-amino-4-deoxy-L-arabinose transferase-like glycosyltransferase
MPSITRKNLIEFTFLCLIFIIALGIRIYPVVVSPEPDSRGLGPFGDSLLYNTLALNLAMGNGFTIIDYRDNQPQMISRPAITRGPAYPFFLSLIYSFSVPGGNFEAGSMARLWNNVRIAQCVLDAFCCILIFLLIKAIYPNSSVFTLVSSAIYAFSFYNIYYTRTILSETLATFLLTLFLLLAIYALREKKKGLFFLAGMVFGSLLLCRPEYVLFAPVFFLYIFFSIKEGKALWLKTAAMYLIGLSLVVLPWSLRNYLTFRRPILISAGILAENAYRATIENRQNWVGYRHFPEVAFIDEDEKKQAEDLHKSYFEVYNYGSIEEVLGMEKAYLKLTWNRICRRPWETVKNWLGKIPQLWYQDYIPIYRDREASGLFFVFYFLFALYAFSAGTREEKILMGPIIALFLYLTIIFIPLHVEPRYGAALMPGIIGLSGIGVGKAALKVQIKTCRLKKPTGE